MSLNFGHHENEQAGQFEGGIMAKDINMNDHNITNLPHPRGQKHAVRKKYVDDELRDKLDKGGDTMTGDLDMGFNKISNLSNPVGLADAISYAYLTRQLQDKLHRDGSIAMTGNLDMNDNKITDLDTPTNDTDAATKKYIDDKIAAIPNPSHYYHFEFASVYRNTWRQSYQLTGFIFWTNDRDIKLTILAHVFDYDDAINIISLHYRIIYWTKAKVKKTKSISKTNITEYNSITGTRLQTYGIFKSVEITDISCFLLEYKYEFHKNIGNESMVHCLIEYI